MPESTPDKDQHDTIESPYRISWRRVLKIILPIFVLFFAIAYWFVGIYTPSKIEAPNTVPTPDFQESTSSAKPATGSAQKDESKEWSIFKNKKFPYQVKYPKGWHSSDAYCSGEDRSNSVLIDRSAEKIICDSSTNGLQVGEFSISTGPVHENFPNVIPECKATQQNIEVASVQAVKYYGPEKPCVYPYTLKGKTFIFFNYKDVGYKIEFVNKDSEGNYDTIYDQILSTFKLI